MFKGNPPPTPSPPSVYVLYYINNTSVPWVAEAWQCFGPRLSPPSCFSFGAERLSRRKSDSGRRDCHHQPHKVGGLPDVYPTFFCLFFPNEKTYKCLIQELFHPQSCFKAPFFIFSCNEFKLLSWKWKKKGQNEALARQIKASANHDRASHDSGGPAYCLFFSSLRIIRQRTQKLIRQCDNSDLRRVASIAPCTDCCICGA